MAIDLSNLIFTNKADIVPPSGTEEIINTGIANTLNGNDRITGSGVNIGIYNLRTIATGSGNDTIEARARDTGIFNQNGGAFIAVIDTGVGNDSIIATGSSTISGARGIYNQGIINTGACNDVITATGTGEAIFNDSSSAIIDTGDGNDTITANGDQGIRNEGGTISTGFGNDVITATGTGAAAIVNFAVIDTGDGNDILTGSGGIYNQGIISTGAGNDIVDTFNGGFSDSGRVLLGIGNDILKGFGSGNFDGGRGKDTLELPSGSYTVAISGTTVSFASNSLTMNTSEFEKLIAGSTTYTFTGLSNGQTFTIA